MLRYLGCFLCATLLSGVATKVMDYTLAEHLAFVMLLTVALGFMVSDRRL